MENRSLDTKHEGMIYDAQFDFYGKRLVTCSADGTIKVFLYSGDSIVQLACLLHHQRAVLSVSWAHPLFGSLLASSGVDCKVFILEEKSPSNWTKVYENASYEAPVNSIAWGPWEVGAVLLTCSFDGCISLISKSQETWESVKFLAHPGGVCSVSWSPVISVNTAYRAFASGGADCKVKVWTELDGSYESESLELHSNAVRWVDWRPIINTAREMLVSCSEDCTVVLWLKPLKKDSWRGMEILRLRTPVWKVSWNSMGNVIAVSAGDNLTRVLRETHEGTWEVATQVDEVGRTVM